MDLFFQDVFLFTGHSSEFNLLPHETSHRLLLQLFLPPPPHCEHVFVLLGH